MLPKKMLTPQNGMNFNSFDTSVNHWSSSSVFWQDVANKSGDLFVGNEILMNYANNHIHQKMFMNTTFENIIQSMDDVHKYLQIFKECDLGYEVVLAGGSVRDAILGGNIKDADFFIRLLPAQTGLLHIRDVILPKYEKEFAKNPFIIFLKNVSAEFIETKKNEPINIFELSIDEYLRENSNEVGNNVLSAVRPYISNLSDEEIIVKDGRFVLNFKKDMTDELVEVDSTVTVLSLMMTLVKDIAKSDNPMFLQLTNLKRDFIKNISYLRFSSRKIGGIVKIDNNMPIDLIFETGSTYPMDSFDWSINKVGIIMESTSVIPLNNFLNINIEKQTPEQVWEILNKNVDKQKINKVFKYEISYLMQEDGTENLMYKLPNKKFIKAHIPALKSTEDIIERVIFNYSFIETLETEIMTYELSFNSFKKLEHEMLYRKNKILMKYPNFDYFYSWAPFILETLTKLKGENADESIEPSFMESVEQLKNFKESIIMKDDMTLERVNNSWVVKEVAQAKRKIRKF